MNDQGHIIAVPQVLPHCAGFQVTKGGMHMVHPKR